MVPLETIPPPGINNVWYIRPDGKSVIVFVHGIHSDSHGCWLFEDENTSGSISILQPGTHDVYWPRLIADEEDFRNFGVYLGGYHTQKKSKDYGLADCAAELYRELTLTQDHARYPLLQSAETILFICHSTGGLVARYMLTYYTAAFREKNIGLILVASPSLGSYYADLLEILIEAFKSDLAETLKTDSQLADDLDRRFGAFVNATTRKLYIPNLVGKEACEHLMIGRSSKWVKIATKLFGGDHKVVDRSSAGRYFLPCEQLAETDHFSIVKPKERSSGPHKFVREAWRDFKEIFGTAAGRQISALPAQRPSQPWVGDPHFIENVWKRLISGDVALYKNSRAGKTLCALELVWQDDVARHFPGGVLWGTITEDWKLDSVLVEWGVSAGLTRDTMLGMNRRANRASAVSNAIGDARVLIVLDHCESAAEAELVATIGSNARRLITTRSREVAALFSPDIAIEMPDFTAEIVRPLLVSAESEYVRNDPEVIDSLLHSYALLPEKLLSAVKFLNVSSEDDARNFVSNRKAAIA